MVGTCHLILSANIFITRAVSRSFKRRILYLRINPLLLERNKVLAIFQNTTDVFNKFIEDIKAAHIERGWSLPEFAEQVGTEVRTLKLVLSSMSRLNTQSPMKSNRLDTILRIRHVLGMETIIKTESGKESFNLNLSEDRDRLAKKVQDWACTSRYSNSELDQIAGLHKGQTAGIIRRPKRYLTLRLMLHTHSKWIEPLMFVS